MTIPTLLAHAGEGATWQALAALAGIGFGAVFLLVVAGRIRLRRSDDLLFPAAAVAILSALAPTGSATLSDWIGWALPVGAVALTGLVVAATSQLELTVRAPLTWACVGIATVGALVLHGPITTAWHPPPDFLPERGDAEIEIISPVDGATVTAGRIRVEVALEGASIGPSPLPAGVLPEDPEELGMLRVHLDSERVPWTAPDSCTVSDPCTSVTFEIEVMVGEHRLTVEFARHDGQPFAPPVFVTSSFTAA